LVKIEGNVIALAEVPGIGRIKSAIARVDEAFGELVVRALLSRRIVNGYMVAIRGNQIVSIDASHDIQLTNVLRSV
jgi:hypothetical protein